MCTSESMISINKRKSFIANKAQIPTRGSL